LITKEGGERKSSSTSLAVHMCPLPSKSTNKDVR
jgi:hypothetical protein